MAKRKKKGFPKIVLFLAALLCISPYAYEKYNEYKLNETVTKTEIWVATTDYKEEETLILYKNAIGYEFLEDGKCMKYTFNGDTIYSNRVSYEIRESIYAIDSYKKINLSGNYLSNEQSCTYKIENGSIFITTEENEEYVTTSGYYTKEDHIRIKWATEEDYEDYYPLNITTSPIFKMELGTIPIKYIYEFALDTYNPYTQAAEEGISLGVDLSTFANHFMDKHQASGGVEAFIKLNLEYTEGIEYEKLFTETEGYKEYVSASNSRIWKQDAEGMINVYTPISKLKKDEIMTNLEIALNKSCSKIYSNDIPIEEVKELNITDILSVEITTSDYVNYLNETITKEYNIEVIEIPEDTQKPVMEEETEINGGTE